MKPKTSDSATTPQTGNQSLWLDTNKLSHSFQSREIRQLYTVTFRRSRKLTALKYHNLKANKRRCICHYQTHKEKLACTKKSHSNTQPNWQTKTFCSISNIPLTFNRPWPLTAHISSTNNPIKHRQWNYTRKASFYFAMLSCQLLESILDARGPGWKWVTFCFNPSESILFPLSSVVSFNQWKKKIKKKREFYCFVSVPPPRKQLTFTFSYTFSKSEILYLWL